MVNQTTTKQKPYFLSDDERLDVGSQIAESLDKTDALQAEKESFAANHKAKEKDLGQHLDKLRKLHRDGFELRDYKCNIVRNSDTHTVDFVIAEGDKAGEIIDQRPWNQDDWNAHLTESQLGIPFDSAGNPDAPDENDLRAQANLTTTPEVQPDMENGQVIGGPNTDAYNMKHPNSPYQHLSELGGLDFAPAIVPAGNPAWDVEMQAMFNDMSQQISSLDAGKAQDFLQLLEDGVPGKTLLPDAAEAQAELRKVVQARIDALNAAEPHRRRRRG